MSARLYWRRLSASVCAVLTLALGVTAHAVDYVWNNAAGGTWHTATNWTPNGVPNSNADTATITLAGTYTVSANANVTVRTVTLGGASGTQTLALPGPSVFTLSAPSTPTMTVGANGILAQSGGTLQTLGSPAQVAIGGRWHWTDGSVTSGVTVTIGPGATVAMSGGGAKTLHGLGATLINNGTITSSGAGSLQIENNATLTNTVTGTIDLQSDAGLLQSGGGTSTLTNAGVLRKSGGGGTSTISLTSVTNTGTIEAQNGTLSITHPGMNLMANGANAFNALTGATLAIGQVGQAFFTGTTFGGAGAKTIGHAAGIYTMLGTIGMTNTDFTTGNLRGSFTLNGTLTWTGGTMGGGGAFALIIPAGATLVVGGFSGKTLDGNAGAHVSNSGTILFNSTLDLGMLGNATIVNQASGLIDFTGNAGVVRSACCGTPSINNAGTLRRSGSTAGMAIVDVTLTNTGTIRVQSGTLAVAGAGTFTQTAGRLELAGGTLNAIRAFTASGGVITGTGNLQGTGAPITLSGSSQTRPGSSPGLLQVFMTPLVQTGALFVELNGPNPGTQYDQILAGGPTVTLGGALNVALGYVPAVGTVFTIINLPSGSSSISGAFAGLPQGATFTVQGVQLQISYAGGDGNDVTLTVVQNTGLICTPFTDVDQADPLCPAVQWMKNRGVTVGCAATLYCPFQPTTRAQMALFMNRLGNVLSDAMTSVELASVAADPNANSLVCQSADQPPAGYERHVVLDGVLMGLGNGTNEIGLEPVASVDGGVNWIALAPPTPFGTVNGHWANVRVNGNRDVAPNQTVRYGMRVSRISGGSGFSDARCTLRLLTGNRTANAGADEND